MYAARFSLSLYIAPPILSPIARARALQYNCPHYASDEMAHVVWRYLLMGGRMNMITEIKANETCGEKEQKVIYGLCSKINGTCRRIRQSTRMKKKKIKNKIKME